MIIRYLVRVLMPKNISKYCSRRKWNKRSGRKKKRSKWKKTFCNRRPMRKETSTRQTQTEQNASVNDSLTCDVRVQCSMLMAHGSWLMLMVWSQRASICFTRRNGNRYQSNSLFTNCARIIFSSTYYFVCLSVCLFVCCMCIPCALFSTLHTLAYSFKIDKLNIYFSKMWNEVKWSVFSLLTFTIHSQAMEVLYASKQHRIDVRNKK